MSTYPPEGRKLPAGVTLRRLSPVRGEEPAPLTLEAVEQWLFAEALAEPDMMTLFESFAWKLRAAGIPLDRAGLHAGTLHPQLFGFAWNWNAAWGRCEEVQVAPKVLNSDAFLLSPLRRVVIHGETLRLDPQDPDAAARFPLMAELAAEGFTDYKAFPLTASGDYHNVMTAATRQPGGFTADQMADCRRLMRVFALHVERQSARQIARNVMEAYLGPDAGERVLAGNIKRGEGDAIGSVVWLSDLRGYTRLSEALPGPDMIALLNAYFERLADAVLDHHGEILKFVGDGLLAVFPFSRHGTSEAAAQAALRAAEDAQKAVAALCADPPPELAGASVWKPLRTVVALHTGDVFFGNVGAPDRLDFTVIGPAVNAVSRVESLAKTLEREIVLTEPVARLLDTPLEPLGEHALRGVTGPVRLYAPAGRLPLGPPSAAGSGLNAPLPRA
jgi:adenylate cyclase